MRGGEASVPFFAASTIATGMIRPKLGETGKGLGPVAEETGRSCSGFATMEGVRVFRRGRQRWRSFGSANCLGQAWRWSNRDGPGSVRPQTVKDRKRRRRRGSPPAFASKGLSPPDSSSSRRPEGEGRSHPWPPLPRLSRSPRCNSEALGQCSERTKTSGPFESPTSERHLLGTIGLRVD
jgi:hypothetical protein